MYTYCKNFQKTAFTLIEIILVVVIIGILSAVFAPRVKRATLQEAADQIASHIRYTQQLALNDNKFDSQKKQWYKSRWQIIFGKSKNSTGIDTDGEWAYTIFSDHPSYTGNPDVKEIAKNPLNPSQLLSGGYSNTLDWADNRVTKSMNIGKKYGIKNNNTGVVFSGGCAGSRRLSFDYLGRPLKGNSKTLTSKYSQNSNNKIIQKDCKITISTGIKSKTIVITPETGYVYIQ